MPWRVRELVIGERAGKWPPLPEHLVEVPADASRLLAPPRKTAMSPAGNSRHRPLPTAR
ncbi:hypothetical protein [Paenibacillus sp. 1P07SE]|uniref:hypothetical protein n=1 Tax=Paenibacillus sp. 1P07SE TaxID=3132209 RepID=UPI0039A76CE4